jgi:alpha-L-fucosidase
MYTVPPLAAVPERMKWLLDARFGMSIHWGAYSVAARGEWVRSNEKLTIEQYQKYIDSFCPDAGVAAEWARLAKSAGMRYCVLTAKHHDGYCLFDSKLTDYTTVKTRPGRDLIREYIDAMRKEGIKVGLYYSLLDWHHPDYPAWHDRQHPMRDEPSSRERDKKCVWQRYLDYYHGQVEELLTNYGTIDQLVFDFSYWDFAGDKWGGSELMKKIRRLQPNIVVNDRLSCEALKKGDPKPYTGDYDHTEQDIPRLPLVNNQGRRIPWDSWFTMTNSWCYNPLDKDYKQAADIIHALVNCVSKGGNLTVNVSPDARGHVNNQTHSILSEVGEWLAKNGESIYGCAMADIPKPEWGRFTQKGNTLYAHILEQVIGHISMPGMRGKIKNGRCVADGSEVFICDYWNPGVQTFDEPDDIFFNFRPPVASTYPLPDRRDTVVKFELTNDKERLELIEKYRKDFAAATAQRDRSLD